MVVAPSPSLADDVLPFSAIGAWAGENFHVSEHGKNVQGGKEWLRMLFSKEGARFFSDLVPPAVEQLPEEQRKRLQIVQQCRPEDMERVQKAYEDLGVTAECAPFFIDLPQRIAQAHLVLCRSGASSVSELSVLGRPSILVPLPGAIDQDQAANAKVLENAGGAWPIRQVDLLPACLAKELARFMDAPDMLTQAARAARTVAKPDAVKRLADLVESVAQNKGVRP